MNWKNLCNVIIAALCGIALAGGVIAEDKGKTTAAQNQKDSNAAGKDNNGAGQNDKDKKDKDEGPVAGRVPLGVTVVEADLVATGWRASKLMRSEVYNDKNQKIGKIDDMVVAPDGSLSLAVIDVGGFLGIGSHKIAIPVRQFKQMHPKLVLPGASKEELKKLPEFVYTS
jgi:sporulation protein YlmC with PRC-barrel domain